jgi:hypothetical protein
VNNGPTAAQQFEDALAEVEQVESAQVYGVSDVIFHGSINADVDLVPGATPEDVAAIAALREDFENEYRTFSFLFVHQVVDGVGTRIDARGEPDEVLVLARLRDALIADGLVTRIQLAAHSLAGPETDDPRDRLLLDAVDASLGGGSTAAEVRAILAHVDAAGLVPTGMRFDDGLHLYVHSGLDLSCLDGLDAVLAADVLPTRVVMDEETCSFDVAADLAQTTEAALRSVPGLRAVVQPIAPDPAPSQTSASAAPTP